MGIFDGIRDAYRAGQEAAGFRAVGLAYALVSLKAVGTEDHARIRWEFEGVRNFCHKDKPSGRLEKVAYGAGYVIRHLT